MPSKCDGCKEPLKPLRKCSSCGRAWYCSKDCQTKDWVFHIFDCNPTRPINTADYLALAVRQDKIPQYFTPTFNDYGFDRATGVGDDAPRQLFEIYKNLFELGVKSMQLHKWRLNGTLAPEIKRFYASNPLYARGTHSSWLSKHERLLYPGKEDPLLPVEISIEMLRMQQHVKRTWVGIGGASDRTFREILIMVHALPLDIGECFKFYNALEIFPDDWRPPPPHIFSTIFGFIALEDGWDHLTNIYRYMKKKSLFMEVCSAIQHGTIPAFLASLSIPGSQKILLNENFLDIMSSPDKKKSVWYLKQILLAKEDLEPSVAVDPAIISSRKKKGIEVDHDWLDPKIEQRVYQDYGFSNCRDDKEHDALTTMYRRLLFSSNVKPLELHQACVEGRLFKYVSAHVKVNSTTYRRLLKNHHALILRGE